MELLILLNHVFLKLLHKPTKFNMSSCMMLMMRALNHVMKIYECHESSGYDMKPLIMFKMDSQCGRPIPT